VMIEHVVAAGERACQPIWKAWAWLTGKDSNKLVGFFLVLGPAGNLANSIQHRYALLMTLFLFALAVFIAMVTWGASLVLRDAEVDDALPEETAGMLGMLNFMKALAVVNNLIFVAATVGALLLGVYDITGETNDITYFLYSIGVLGLCRNVPGSGRNAVSVMLDKASALLDNANIAPQGA